MNPATVPPRSGPAVSRWPWLVLLALAPGLHAHLTGDAAHDRGAARLAAAAAALSAPAPALQLAPAPASAEERAAAIFARFAPQVRVTRSGEHLLVEANGLPDHPLMVGITAWQQQVPLPQRYTGTNAWRIPLRPVPARVPLSARSHFFKGAIALAANGVPIFNPIKTNGRTDTFLAGELDEFGGHCGRADDYHYHIAPLHLQEVLGPGLPLAYALDGYPLYGLTEPDGSAPRGLDAFNGHHSAELGYHYHASKTYPYVNGGFHGEVVERDGQVDPQPRTNGVRPALPPLPGARITGFARRDDREFSVKYQVRGEARTVLYALREDGSVKFDFVDGAGVVRTEVHSGRTRGGGSGGKAGGEPRRSASARPPEPARAAPAAAAPAGSSSFVLTSPAFKDGDPLPPDFNGDGAGVTPPLAWNGAPEGTEGYALIMDHTDRDGVLKTYWVLHDIPATATGLPRDVRDIGRAGATWKRGQSYVPPHSSGGARQTYTIHLYALSAAPALPGAAGPVTREQLLAAMEGRILARADLRATYQRPGGEARGGEGKQGKGRPLREVGGKSAPRP